jgi:hypothetical protein
VRHGDSEGSWGGTYEKCETYDEQFSETRYMVFFDLPPILFERDVSSDEIDVMFIILYIHKSYNKISFIILDL